MMMDRGNPPFTRRDFLRLLLMTGGGFMVSCSQPLTHLVTSMTSTPSGFQPAPISTFLATESPPPPTSTAPPTTATPPANVREKIDTVIILLEENHSFDSLFASYPGADGKAAPKSCPSSITRPMPEAGTSFEYACSYSEPDVPNYWKLAQSFTLCDNYFSEVRYPSFPNYLMLTTAQSPTLHDPVPAFFECPSFCFNITSIANRLDDKGVTWHDYGGLFANIKSLHGRPEISFRKLDGFYQDAAGGKLANVSWIGTFLAGGLNASGHPPANICDAENFAIKIVNAVMASPQWPTTMLIITWDEWGSFFDHIVPPVVEKLPDGQPFRYGYRVPCLVISPYSRAGYVSHTEYSHVSTLRSLEDIFDMPPLNDRDGAANSLLDCLDLTQAPIPPFALPVRTCSS